MSRFTQLDVDRLNAKAALGRLKNEKNTPPKTGLSDAQHSEPAVELAGGGEGETQGGRCPLVRFTLRRKAILDVDAKYASVKHILDGIVATGIVAGDKEGQITLEVIQQKVAKGEKEVTEIEVFYFD